MLSIRGLHRVPFKNKSFYELPTNQSRLFRVSLGLYGNPQVKTPNLDALAKRSWIAEQFFVASPICMPNRASLLTGRMPSVHGARCNGIPLSRRATTFVDVLREQGYATALVGKSHLQNISGFGPLWPQAGQRLEKQAWPQDPGEYDDEWGPRWAADPQAELHLPFYGFEHVDLVINHGDNAGGHYRRWLETEHPDIAAVSGPEHAIPNDYELVKAGQAWRTQVPEELSTTSWIADRTIDNIRRSTETDQPFFVQCSFPDPHHPFTPPGRYWDMYDPDEIVLPESFHHTGPKPPHVAWMHQQRDTGRAVKNTPAPFACTEREAREAIALNYGSITHIDDAIGRILQELERLGLADNTVIVFTSDHGDYFGDHQLLFKGPIHYNGLVQVPFLWADPKQQSEHRSRALYSAIDLAPSILERAGLPTFHGIQGQSFLNDVTQQQPVKRNGLVIEEEGQRVMFGFPNRVRMRTLRTPDWRISIYQGAEWGELYNLSADPHKCTNLWDAPEFAHDRARLTEQLTQLMMANTEESPYPTALA